MPKATVVDETAAPTVTCMTDWEAFEKAGLVPEEIVCEGYKPTHAADISCHSKLVPTLENIKNHLAGDHGGGFVFKLRKTDGKAWPGWKALRDEGLELHDFRCDVCDARELRVNPRFLIAHMRPHAGKVRRPMPGGRFLMTLGSDPLPSDESTE